MLALSVFAVALAACLLAVWFECPGTACLVGILTFFGVVAYFAPPPDPNSRESRLDRGEAVLTSRAPDGTKLWLVRRDGRDVYFSTAGTQYTRTEHHGKTTETVDVSVPNAR